MESQHSSSISIPQKKGDVSENISKEHSLLREGSVDEILNPKAHFSMVSCLGACFSITAAPLTIGTYLSVIIGAGGSPFFFYNFLVTGLGQLLACIVIAEIASAYPHTSGPAHWITQLGPPRYTKILSYLIGWVTNALWLFTTSGTILVLVNTLFACIEATHSDYVRQVWHVYLTYVAVSGFALIINLPKGMHLVTFALTYVTIYVNATILFVLITLLVRVYPKQSAETVFITVVNETGWSSNALVFFLSLLPGLAAINGFDTASHMTEETQNPSRDIPLSMIGAAGISYVGAIPAILVYMYCVVDSDALVNAVGNQPMIQLIKDGFRSKPLFILASVLIIFIIGISSVVSLMSWSRLYCAFSKTNGLPGSSFTSRNISVEGVPLNALYVTTVLTIAIGAIQLGSETAMVSIIGGSCLCAALTYAILFALLLKKGRSSLPADRWLKLGPFGTPITILALAWESWAIFWMCFPMYYPVTAINMNYTSVVVVGILILCPLYYFVCRHNFQLS